MWPGRKQIFCLLSDTLLPKDTFFNLTSSALVGLLHHQGALNLQRRTTVRSGGVFFRSTNCNNCIQTTLQCAIKMRLGSLGAKSGLRTSGTSFDRISTSCFATASYKPYSQHNSRQRRAMETFAIGHKKLKSRVQFCIYTHVAHF